MKHHSKPMAPLFFLTITTNFLSLIRRYHEKRWLRNSFSRNESTNVNYLFLITNWTLKVLSIVRIYCICFSFDSTVIHFPMFFNYLPKKWFINFSFPPSKFVYIFFYWYDPIYFILAVLPSLNIHIVQCYYSIIT